MCWEGKNIEMIKTKNGIVACVRGMQGEKGDMGCTGPMGPPGELPRGVCTLILASIVLVLFAIILTCFSGCCWSTPQVINNAASMALSKELKGLGGDIKTSLSIAQDQIQKPSPDKNILNVQIGKLYTVSDRLIVIGDIVAKIAEDSIKQGQEIAKLIAKITAIESQRMYWLYVILTGGSIVGLGVAAFLVYNGKVKLGLGLGASSLVCLGSIKYLIVVSIIGVSAIIIGAIFVAVKSYMEWKKAAIESIKLHERAKQVMSEGAITTIYNKRGVAGELESKSTKKIVDKVQNSLAAKRAIING